MDRTTKLLLAAIALGLWANVASLWAPVSAQSYELTQILYEIQAIGNATCNNPTIC